MDVTPVVPHTDAVFDVHALYRLTRAHGAVHGVLMVLHIGAARTLLALGTGDRDPATVLSLSLGHSATAQQHFRAAMPTPLELETAIAAVEDEVYQARRRALPWMGGGELTAWAVDPALFRIAALAGATAGSPCDLPLASVEQLFSRVAAVVQGRPASQERLPDDPAFVATVLILRELMHHLPLAGVRLFQPADALAAA